jgi:PAS domain S-box-containing protein
VSVSEIAELPVIFLSPNRLPESILARSDNTLAGHLVITAVDNIDDCLIRYRTGEHVAIVVDASLGETDTVNAVRSIRVESPSAPVILLAPGPDVDSSIVHRLGVQDVLTPSEVARGFLPRVVRNAVELTQSSAEEKRLIDLIQVEREKATLFQREIASLLNTIRRISNATDVLVTIDSILDTAIELTDADTVGIALISPDGSEVRYEAARGIGAELVTGLTCRIGEGLTGAAARSNAAIVVSDATSDLFGLHPELVTIGGLHSGLFVPLQSASQRIGVVAAWSRQPGFFTRNHEAVLGDLAAYAELAIEHVRSQTEYELAQAALRRSEQEFHLVIENSSDVIMVLEEDATIRYVSPAIEHIIGFQPQELRDHSLFDYVESDDQGMAMTAYRTAAAHPASAEYVDLQARHRDGTIRMLSVAITNLVDQPAVDGIVLNVRDVTEHHRLADQLRQSQKLEAIGRLAGGVAHDFNNLLTVINGFSELILSDMSQGDARVSHVHQIVEAGNSAATLTRQLLAFSRQQVLSPRVLDLNLVVQATDSLLHRLIGENIELSIELGPDLGQAVADPGQIEQAIVNLALYARGRMPNGGKLTIRTQNVSSLDPILLKHPGARPIQQVLLSISDTGPTIDDVTRNQIFEPFLLSDGMIGDTGLGLAAVYGIVKQSDGDIFVSSSKESPTSFHILLPRVDTPERPDVGPRTGDQTARDGETVLLVEDEDRVRSFVRIVLENNGYQVLEANRGEAGLAISRKHDGPIQVLVTDIVMPGISGRQLAEQLLRERPTLKIVYMSGYTDDEVIRYGVLGPGASFIAKPFAPTTLALTVRQVLDSG